MVFGTGWYVRGDLGGVQLFKANPFAQRSILNISSPSGYAATPSLERGHDLGYTADLGAGYSFNRWFRADVIFDFHQPLHTSTFSAPVHCQTGFTAPAANGAGNLVSYPTYSSCYANNQARLRNYDGLVNGYLDLGTWYGATPYIGGGAGLGFGRAQASSNYYLPSGRPYDLKLANSVNGQSYRLSFDSAASAQYYNFAYAAMAGVAFQVFDHTKLDIGYRYLNQGHVLGTTLDEHEVRAGLRYMIDN